MTKTINEIIEKTVQEIKGSWFDKDGNYVHRFPNGGTAVIFTKERIDKWQSYCDVYWY